MCGNSFKDGASHRKKVGVLPTITGNLLEGGGKRIPESVTLLSNSRGGRGG